VIVKEKEKVLVQVDDDDLICEQKYDLISLIY
jgi:hypothetical protein